MESNQIAETWMVQWRSLLENSGVNPNRRLRNVRVPRLAVEPGIITARVKENQHGSYSVTLEWPVLSDEAWQAIAAQVAEQQPLASRIVSGELPLAIAGVFGSLGYRLLPSNLADWMTTCQPLEGAAPVTVALEEDLLSATYLMLGEAIVDEPWLLIRLRGRNRQQFIQEIRKPHTQTEGTNGASGRSATSASSSFLNFGHSGHGRDKNGNGNHEIDNMPESSLEAQISEFWGRSKDLRDVQHQIIPPSLEQILLRRLGTPVFAEDSDALYQAFEQIYRQISEQALVLAYTEEPESDKPMGEIDDAGEVEQKTATSR